MTQNYRLSFDQDDFQLEVIHGFLSTVYWSENIPRETIERAVQNSIAVGAFNQAGQQVGFARVVTDRATFAYLADVFVLPDHRAQGLAQKMVQSLRDHEELQGLRRWLLATSDAHGVYGKLGFKPLGDPDLFMEINHPDIYQE